MKKLSKLLLSAIAVLSLIGCGTRTITEGDINLPEHRTVETVSTEINNKTELRVDYIDVGQGDAELLRSNGQTMLIDTGTPESGTKIRLFLKKQGVEKLDYLVLTHPDADHIGGAASVITNVPVDHVLMPDYSKDNKTYNGVMDALDYKSIKAECPIAGDTFTLGTCTVDVLGPIKQYEDANNCSIVLKVTCGDNKFIFIGDAEEDELNDIVWKYGNELDSDVYKVGHHGSHNSSSEAFLSKVTPIYSVISCDEGNDYGHPHAETLIRLREIGSELFRTDKQGLITINSDGTNITYDPTPCNDWTPGENTINTQNYIHEEIYVESDPVNESAGYVLNKNSKKFHLSSCSSVQDMAEKNKSISKKDRDEIIGEGYKPCKICNP